MNRVVERHRDAIQRTPGVCSAIRRLAGFIRLVALPGLVAGLAVAQKGPSLAELRTYDRDRDRKECSSEILDRMSVRSGSWAADIGAGPGYYTERLSSLVGPGGRVFAVDVSDYALDILRQRVRESRLRNVVVIEGKADDPFLAPGSLDAVLVMRSYQYFTQPLSMLKHIGRALKPQGRVVLVDYRNRESRPGDSRERQAEARELAMSIAESELIQAGFQIVEARDPVCRTGIDPKSDRMIGDNMWLIVARRR